MIIFEKESSFVIGSRAELLPEDREIAASHWASKYAKPNKAYGWILGRYAEADRGNNNKQKFLLEDLRERSSTLQHAPMNINHIRNKVVGTFIASEMMYPVSSDPEASNVENQLNPYLEALAVVWKAGFPTEYAEIKAAQDEGSLFFSMEAIPEKARCSMCHGEFEYAGPQSEGYCDHINDRESDRILVNPHFVGGALVIPPARPGWSHANIKELSAREHVEELLHQFHSEFSDLDAPRWEALMAELLTRA